MPSSPLRLVTHSGTFHCDDAFAYAILRLALGLGGSDGDHTLTRTRDPGLIAAADIVWDVGALHDPVTGASTIISATHRHVGTPACPTVQLA